MPEQLAFNMDCLEAMRGMPDKAFDLAVVDPPYRDMSENQPTKDMRKNGTMKSFGNKPDSEYFKEWIISKYAKPGDKILDTHLGSGSSRIAAYDLGFDFVGYEIDKFYFDKQEERFERHTAQIDLFH